MFFFYFFLFFTSRVLIIECVNQGILWHGSEDLHLHKGGGSEDEPGVVRLKG